MNEEYKKLQDCMNNMIVSSVMDVKSRNHRDADKVAMSGTNKLSYDKRISMLSAFRNVVDNIHTLSTVELIDLFYINSEMSFMGKKEMIACVLNNVTPVYFESFSFTNQFIKYFGDKVQYIIQLVFERPTETNAMKIYKSSALLKSTIDYSILYNLFVLEYSLDASFFNRMVAHIEFDNEILDTLFTQKSATLNGEYIINFLKHFSEDVKFKNFEFNEDILKKIFTILHSAGTQNNSFKTMESGNAKDASGFHARSYVFCLPYPTLKTLVGIDASFLAFIVTWQKIIASRDKYIAGGAVPDTNHVVTSRNMASALALTSVDQSFINGMLRCEFDVPDNITDNLDVITRLYNYSKLIK